MTQQQFEMFESRLISRGYKRDYSGADCDHTYTKKISGKCLKYFISVHFRIYSDTRFTDTVSMWVTYLVTNREGQYREMTVVRECTDIDYWQRIGEQLYEQYNKQTTGPVS